MNHPSQMKDLILLAACKNIEYTIKGLLERRIDLKIKQISYDIFIHPQRDPGCLNFAHDFLRAYSRQYNYAMVIFDHVGCGKENVDRRVLEEEIVKRLNQNGWPTRSTAVAIEPELEIWIWGEYPQVASVLGWSPTYPDLRSWLMSSNFLQEGQKKPQDPKRVFEKVLRFLHQPRSSSIYFDLARQVNFANCSDIAFQKFKSVLQQWFSK